MNSRRRDTRLDPHTPPLSDETLADFISLGSQLAAKAAAVNFKTVTARPDWTEAQVEAEVERSISRMEIAARDALIALRGDPDSDLWDAVWTEMQRSYRETMAGLVRGSDPPAGDTLQ